ncbi:putative membrane protein [Rhodococcus rhodochrous J3]|uniref:DUF202 domain-containing protein n=3 Tax=Rhodococcus rhodochrous TaxID=1829 RepID=A0AA46X116_RHORH|nr:DUF202 domain-containing protein [Rhodococcus rhodochrous]MBF4477849.1 DUF202 domain-containing protein [Rhodococcus rhodochrous]MCB8913792.1 DUF202 domain-containing protein [Rhodococcus rhodochrous]MCD2099846.1 DUF202 domain-containing protein [Rhodococcus rhodochrous]MCD2124276.1 DUF202 domain-containing protein [Rhodococcus rhodochrous]MCQ4137131.1 DUF202 domain-containing protein [Rhodococcus rhodochrous]
MRNASPQRRPRAVYSVGTEPDVRFSLANERTALAWVRTALALIAGGVTLTTVAGLTPFPLIIYGLSLVACVAGGLLALLALLSWRRNERALRMNLPLPAPLALPWLVTALVIVSVGLTVFAVTALALSL